MWVQLSGCLRDSERSFFLSEHFYLVDDMPGEDMFSAARYHFFIHLAFCLENQGLRQGRRQETRFFFEPRPEDCKKYSVLRKSVT